LLSFTFKRLAAAVGAAAAVTATTQQVRGEKAEPAVGITERAMDEGFGFDSAVPADMRDLFQAEFARQHDALDAEHRELFRPFQIVDSELRAGVQTELRKIFLSKPDNAHILHDNTVSIQIADECQRFECGRKFALLNERIEGDVNAAAEVMRAADQFIERFGRKISGLGAGGKARQAGVNGVRAVRQRGPRRFGRSGRSQEFWKFFIQAARTLSCRHLFFKV